MHTKIVVILISLSPFHGQEISDSINSFTVDLLATINRNNEAPKNLALSPYTIWNLFAILDEGAKGNTARQIESVLRISAQKGKFRRDFKNHTNILQSQNSGIDLNIFTAAFTNNKERLKTKYQDIIRGYYGVTVQPTNFSNQKAACEKINNYVARATKNRINDLIQPDDLVFAQIFLVSALHFKGEWTFPFNESLTKLADFRDENGQKLGTVQMMHQIASYAFARLEWLKSSAVELPYGENEAMSMILILPFKDQKIQETLDLMRSGSFSRITDRLDKMKEDYEDEGVELFLPKFKAASDLTLNSILMRMGVTDVFDASSADFTNMFNTYLYVTRMIHRAEIEVNEEGTVASAATGASTINKIPPPVFNANRPFLYFILNKKTKTIIFAGKLSLPETM